jgi:formylglycine-generating enzyme required for sulfatase activity
VTNGQYARFIGAGGYDEQGYWTKAGWAWRRGDFGEKPEDWKDEWWEWVTGRRHFDQPEFWDDRQWNVPNQPVVGVTWHEALAYTRWLTGVWRSEGRIGRDQVVRLPTEMVFA